MDHCPTHYRSLSLVVLACAVLGACQESSGVSPFEGQPLEPLPPPLLDIAATDRIFEYAVLAGGCFWSVEAVFEHVNGVYDVVSGYAGGTAEDATYKRVVSDGDTDHAEVVEIAYDPNVISYGQLLQIFFSAAHDPTEVDRQGPDIGSHYRSHIYYRTDAERDVAEAYIAQIDAAGVLERPIATRVDRLVEWFWAEEQHQDYVFRNPTDRYVLSYSIPKLHTMVWMFPDFYRESRQP